jgi:hypothetical protein
VTTSNITTAIKPDIIESNGGFQMLEASNMKTDFLGDCFEM